VFELHSWPGFAIATLIALAAAAVIVLVATVVLAALGRKRTWASQLAKRGRAPFRALLLVIALWVGVTVGLPFDIPLPQAEIIDHAFLIATIAIGAWFAAALVIYFEDLGLARYRVDGPDNRYARRVRTQVLIIRRLTVVAAVVVAVGAILLTFPGARAAGASILASAGLISVVAGIAAQSTLGNVFAGVQLAFSGAIRLDDVVIVDQQWGKIEEITLTYVVVHLWDDRRMVLPSTYFTTKPFENWTRNESQLLGSVEFDLDWRVSPGAMRAELTRVLAKSDLWDERVGVLQVTDAVGGFVHIRVMVSAKDAGTLFDLRCRVREELIEWLRASNPEAFPRTRVQMVEAGEAPRRRPARRAGKGEDGAEGMFSGSPDAVKRATQFTDSLTVVPDVDTSAVDTGAVDTGAGNASAGNASAGIASAPDVSTEDSQPRRQ
jgi:small-conductance mechanosensitive channel